MRLSITVGLFAGIWLISGCDAQPLPEPQAPAGEEAAAQTPPADEGQWGMPAPQRTPAEAETELPPID